MSTPAGWYPDPSGSTSQLRWWDGQAWTDHVHTPEAPVNLDKSDHRDAYQQPGGWQQSGGSQQRDAYRSPSPWTPGVTPSPTERQTHTPDGQPLGNLGLRLLARVIDFAVVQLIITVAAWGPLQEVVTVFRRYLDEAVAAGQTGATPPPAMNILNEPGIESALNSYLWISVAVSAVYVILFTRFFGGTPGKLLCRLRVRGWERAGLPTWGQSITRWISRELPANLLPVFGPVYLLLDSLWPLWDKRSQALHDKLGKTVVVRR